MDLISSASAKGKIRLFNCTICGESLKYPGPPLESFSFGRLLKDLNQLSFSERDLMFREFTLFDQCFMNGNFDCDKILSTSCGHLYHSGCIREWFFIRRLDRIKKCPFCNQRTTYDECWVIHPLSCNPDEVEDEIDEPSSNQVTELDTNAEPDYSDISCASSSYSSNDDDSDIESDQPMNEIDPVISEGMPETNSTENAANEDSIVEAESDQKGVCARVASVIDRYNVVHLAVLYFAFNLVLQRNQERKREFSTMLDYIDDERLAETEEIGLVPLGYDFIANVMLTFWIVWAYEGLLTRLFRMNG